MGELLIQVWVRSQWVIGQTSECTKREFDKKLPRVHAGYCKLMKKCVMKMKEEKTKYF